LYSITRLLFRSAMKVLPNESIATPLGSHRLVAEGLKQKLLVKLFCPKTKSADGSVLEEAGVLNSSTRLLVKSTTYRLPLPSSFTSIGALNDVALVEPPRLALVLVKLVWPKTPLAANEVVTGGLPASGLLNWSTRLLMVSAI